jgi:ATP-dependent exoDNAse (exonuclease V) beta subunit
MADLLTFPATTTPSTPSAIPDAGERERALDTRRSFLVEAPAGSGKTGLLIQRYLKLLAGADVTDPAQVLAITFTRKATAEMRERILGQLTAAALGTTPEGEFDRATRTLAQAVLDRDRALGWNLLDQPAQLNIRTIDSVCSEIARALPILSGSAAGAAPTEDAQPLYTEAARRTLMLLGGDDEDLDRALAQMLLHRDGSLADLERLIAQMLATRDQWGDLIPAGRMDDATLEAEVLPRLEKALDQAICRALTQLTRLLAPSHLDRLCELAAGIAHAEGYNGKPNPVALCAGLRQPPPQLAAHLDHWRALASLLVTASQKSWRKSFNINHINIKLDANQKLLLKELVDDLRHDEPLCAALCALENLPPARYPEDQWRVARHLLRVLAQAQIELQAVFVERGQCDFGESSLLARAALRNQTSGDDLAAATGLRLRHLLVDEMQDTSSTQYELIELLTQGWGRAGETVFLVGDPKQSIYSFRQARVERFLHTMRTGLLGRGAPPVEVLHLTANFRSRPALVSAFNEDFSRLFPPAPDPARPEQVPFRSAVAIREPAPTLARRWHTALLAHEPDPELRRQSRAQQQRIDAEDACSLIAEWRERPLPPTRQQKNEAWRIAVLGRTRGELLPIIATLKETGIPYRAVKIDPLSERPEILDLLALTRALLHPADRTAWLALLRSPWCGLKLADLHTLAAGDDPEWSERTILQAIKQRASLISDDGRARLAPFWAILRSALDQRRHRGVAQLVSSTWRAFGSPAFASEESLTNCERFFTLLDELEQAPGLEGNRLDLDLLASRLDALHATPSTAADAVDVMTIHGAKGLEWDVVVVPSLHRGARQTQGKLLDWLEVEADGEPLDHTSARGIFAPIKSKGGPGQQLNQWMRSIESSREAAERKRLFYVACTRAREELHLFASPGSTAKGAVEKPHNSLLAAAWDAAEEHFAGIAPAPLTHLAQMPPRNLIESLAAAAALPANRIERMPLPPAHSPSASNAAAPTLARPEGSFAARVFGNTMHTFLELLARRAATASFATLLDEVPTWTPRIAAVLRAGGLAPAELETVAARVSHGLLQTLEDKNGRWLLAPHPGAASEVAIASRDDAGQPTTLRLDRIFRAGDTPLSTGNETRWIVDFKTSDHGPQGLDAWLEAQRQTYAPQLERYALAFAHESIPARLALYFPMLQRLLWWPYEPNLTNHWPLRTEN